ncbi:MAG TPA: LysM domain-containing protein [Acidimicrobiales bacterium]|nr:LysM domain-containing protein [Acidimicrobiales bacterium]
MAMTMTAAVPLAVPGPAALPRRPAPRPAPRTVRAPVASARVRRRRLVVLMALAVLLPTARAGAGLLSGGSLTAAGQAAGTPSVAASARIYVVQPGDTVWAIAHRLHPAGDERPLVDAIDSELGGRPLVPGQAISIP